MRGDSYFYICSLFHFLPSAPSSFHSVFDSFCSCHSKAGLDKRSWMMRDIVAFTGCVHHVMVTDGIHQGANSQLTVQGVQDVDFAIKSLFFVDNAISVTMINKKYVDGVSGCSRKETTLIYCLTSLVVPPPPLCPAGILHPRRTACVSDATARPCDWLNSFTWINLLFLTAYKHIPYSARWRFVLP